MKEIGGYFELEFKRGYSYHPNAIALNTARNCFEYILRAKNIKKVFIPHYTCDVMLEPINKLGVDFEYYHIDSNLEPILSVKDLNKTFLIYTNYYGIKQNYIKKVSEKHKNLIIDNCQAFYYPQVDSLDTFYSARKFFGVPDGGYLYTNKLIQDNSIEKDLSYDRISHLIKRIDLGANLAYPEFIDNDLTLNNQPIRRMSKFSQIVLESIDYDYSKDTRERNFMYLHNNLHTKNELEIDLSDLSGPMCYPFLFRGEKIRKGLIEKRIYVPTFWKSVFNTTKKGDLEQYLTNYLLPLPVDHRYDISDMDYIISVLKNYL